MIKKISAVIHVLLLDAYPVASNVMFFKHLGLSDLPCAC